MWRMSRPDGRHVLAVVDPAGRGASVVWLLNDSPVGVRHFDDWTSAIEWTDKLWTQYWTVGWRPVEDPRKTPPATNES